MTEPTPAARGDEADARAAEGRSAAPRVHDYGPGRRCWGHDFSIMKVVDGGQQIHVSGWGPILGPRIREGDYLLLANGDCATRYRVTEIAYQLDPPDMWVATLDFDPRTTNQTGENP